MYSSSFVLFIQFLCQLVTAIKALSGHPVLEPVSDYGWDNSVRRRSMKDSLKLLDFDHMVWNSAAGKQHSAAYSMCGATLIRFPIKTARIISLSI